MALTGPRQAGKTTLLKSLFGDYEYISLENNDNKSFAESDPRGFLLSTTKNMIIDEAQKVPKIFSYLQEIVDQKDNKKRYILSGSQNFLLLQSITQSLAGRIALLKLLPYSFDEINSFDTKIELDQVLFQGGYPSIYNQFNPIDWYPNYINTYVERDVRQIINVGNLSLFQDFLKLCTGQIGQILNTSSLATQLGVSHNTINSWLSVLESSYIAYRLTPYSRNIKKRVVKSPKLYFFDTGLAASLLGIRKSTELRNHWAYGQLFENFIINEFQKKYYNQGQNPSLYFIRDSLGHEIDLIIEKSLDKLHGIEIKASMTIKDNFWKNLNYWYDRDKIQVPSFLIWSGGKNQNRGNFQVINWNRIKSLDI